MADDNDEQKAAAEAKKITFWGLGVRAGQIGRQ